MPVKKGDTVKVDYTGSLDDGNVFDSSDGRQPLEFEVGSGCVIKGFDDAVVGMEKGEEKDIRIEAKDAYGEYRDDLLKEIPRDQVPEGEELNEGMMVAIGLPDGTSVPATISVISEDSLTLDLNHPLAGKTLNFKIKLIEYNC